MRENRVSEACYGKYWTALRMRTELWTRWSQDWDTNRHAIGPK